MRGLQAPVSARPDCVKSVTASNVAWRRYLMRYTHISRQYFIAQGDLCKTHKKGVNA